MRIYIRISAGFMNVHMAWLATRVATRVAPRVSAFFSARIMVLTITCLTVLFCSATALAETDAYIKLELDSREVYLGDSVVLDVKSTGLLDPIDFSVLNQNATVLRQTSGTRIAVIAGKVQEIVSQRIDLEPKQSGVLVIGPLIAGDLVSNTVHLNVLAAPRPQWAPDPSDAQIITSLTPDNVTVNQQMLYTIALLHRYPINSESVVLPDLSGFSRRALIERRRNFKDEKKDWYRTEWQTLLYPQRSGEISIGAIEWSGTLVKSNVERASFSRRSEPMTVPVSSASRHASDWWLPASSVVLSDSWSFPPTQLRAGDEVERTIKVQANDVLAGQIPTPALPQSRALTQMLIHSQRQETLTPQGVMSTADFVYRVTAQSPIPVFLDTVRIPWYDTQQQMMREAIIPARRINVALPDRADVLGKLALEEGVLNQLKFQLQAVSPLRFSIYIAAGFALLYLLRRSVPVFFDKQPQRRHLNRHLRQLQDIARQRDAHQLYRTLQTSKSRQMLQGSEQKLVSRLEEGLFGEHVGQGELPLMDWLAPVVKQARQAHKSVHTSPADGLAQL